MIRNDDKLRLVSQLVLIQEVQEYGTGTHDALLTLRGFYNEEHEVAGDVAVERAPERNELFFTRDVCWTTYM
jgi:hypothetical protein|tara:strand:- start:653 stop:868 length:216 start_codon:yes stop_codon:yes gene_type:complete